MGLCLGSPRKSECAYEDTEADDWYPCMPRLAPVGRIYKLGTVLGTGGSAVVREGLSKSDGRPYAVKIFRKRGMNVYDVDGLVNEVTLLSNLDHPGIVKVHDFLEEPRRYCVVMDLLEGGELFDRITEKSLYTEKQARDLFRNLLKALAYLHDHNIAHRDIKPDNLLLRSKEDDISVVIADFGLAVRLLSEDERIVELCGTPGYVAPEVLSGEGYGKAVDMWSLGVVMYVLLSGRLPFYDQTGETHSARQRIMFEKIQTGIFEFEDRFFGQVSKEAKDLISAMLTVDADKRITAHQALEHPWMDLDDSTLGGHMLEIGKRQLVLFNARRKLRASVQTLIATSSLKQTLMKLRVRYDLLSPTKEGGGAAMLNTPTNSHARLRACGKAHHGSCQGNYHRSNSLTPPHPEPPKADPANLPRAKSRPRNKRSVWEVGMGF